VAGVFLAGARLAIQGLNAHALHQGADMLAAHRMTGTVELIPNPYLTRVKI
jgi:hypothetical protein